MQVGEQIKRLRSLKKMSLTQLAQESGVQIATISRIENGKMTGTLQSHLNIAKALGVDLTELYQNLAQEEPLATNREDTLEAISAHEGKFVQHILAKQVTAKKMLPLMLRLEPRGSTPHEAQPAGTERFVYVLEGTVQLKLKDKTVKLSPKMSLYYNASSPNNIENLGDKPAKLLVISSPVYL